MSKKEEKLDLENEELENQELENQEELVSKKAYIGVSKDLHKYKKQMKDQAQIIADLQAQLEAQKMAKLEEEKNWEQIAQLERQQKEEAINYAKGVKETLKYNSKVKALEDFVGGFSNRKLLVAIKKEIDSISIDEDNNPVQDDVEKIGNMIIQDMPMLVKAKSTQDLPDGAPRSPNLAKDFSVKGKTPQEIEQMLREIEQNS